MGLWCAILAIVPPVTAHMVAKVEMGVAAGGARLWHDFAALFRRKVHIGYLAAIVAASNAGGSGSVVGDTTTTMMWIDGVSPLSVLEAFVKNFA